MTSERSAPSSSPSPSGGGRSAIIDITIPVDFLPYVATQDHLRCGDCKGYTVHAATIGIVGRFCSCVYDREHS